MKYLILFLVLLCGCTSEVTPIVIAQAEELCKTRGGLKSLSGQPSTSTFKHHYIVCNNEDTLKLSQREVNNK